MERRKLEWSEILAIRQGYDTDGVDEKAPQDVATLDPPMIVSLPTLAS